MGQLCQDQGGAETHNVGQPNQEDLHPACLGRYLRCRRTMQTRRHNAESYDVDWGSGTIWHESSKIASATHRQPVPNTAVIVMPGGWVNLKAIMDVTGCTETEARSAFEREL